MNKLFYKCEICGNIIGKIKDSGVAVVCCGQKMTQMEVHTEDGPYEKHKPVVKIEKNLVTVKIGSVEHPMTSEHFIEWIYIKTKNGGQRKALSPGMKPTVTFALFDDTPLEVFSYCNLHGLWYLSLQ